MKLQQEFKGEIKRCKFKNTMKAESKNNKYRNQKVDIRKLYMSETGRQLGD